MSRDPSCPRAPRVLLPRPPHRLALVALVAALAGSASAQSCGDCNSDGTVSILDALRAAQIAVALLSSTPADLLVCDADDDLDIDILDALRQAQEASGIPAGLVCPVAIAVNTVITQTGPTAGTDIVPIAGGETVEVQGAGFRTGATVSINGASVPATVLDPATLTFVAPPEVRDSVFDVIVSHPIGLAGTLPDGITYTQEFSLDPFTDAFDRALAHHLYRRAGFGGSPTEIDAAVAAGLAATVIALVDYTNDTSVELAAQATYAGALPPRASTNERLNKEWWAHMLVKNPNPFQEKLAWLLHDHFAISEHPAAAESRWFMYSYVNLLRRFSMDPNDSVLSGDTGLDYDWRAMLIAMGKERAMLEWLSGIYSRRWAPNENYARELWELFALGEGNGYTENDIREAAKAFTGFFWYFTGGVAGGTALEVRYKPSYHEAGPKTIFGVTGNFGYDDLAPFYETSPGPAGFPELGTTSPTTVTDPLDTGGGIVALTLAQRPVEASRFICQRLCEWFLYDNPHDLVIDALAADLRAAGPDQWNLRPIIERILLSKAFFSQAAIKSKASDPADFVIGFLRMTRADLSAVPTTNAVRIIDRLYALDQVPLDPPNVSGWPHGLAWVTPQGMLTRFNFLAYTVSQLDSIAQIIALVPSPRGSITPTSLVDHIAGTLDVTLTTTARQAYIDYVSTDYVGGVPVPLAFNPNDDNHLRIKTRGLLWLIGQHFDTNRN